MSSNTQHGIFIRNLHPSIDEQALQDTFSQFGNILSSKINSEKENGFVYFESEESAKTAVERVHGMLLKSRLVSVVLASESPDEFTEVFMRNMKTDITEEELKNFLNKNIDGGDDDSIKDLHIGHDKDTNVPWATVTFKSHEIAADIVNKLNGKTDTEIKKDETALYVARHLHRPQPKARAHTYSQTSLYVKNLDDTITDKILQDAFSRFGEVSSAKVMMDNSTPPQSKGFGFVNFKEVESAYKAIAEMNGYLLGSKPLYVNIAQPKEVRRANLEVQYASRFGPRGPVPQIPPGYGYPPQQVYPPPFGAPVAPGFFNIPGRGMPPRGWPAPGPFPGARGRGGFPAYQY